MPKVISILIESRDEARCIIRGYPDWTAVVVVRPRCPIERAGSVTSGSNEIGLDDILRGIKKNKQERKRQKDECPRSYRKNHKSVGILGPRESGVKLGKQLSSKQCLFVAAVSPDTWTLVALSLIH